MSHPLNAATATATAIVDELVRCGVRDVVLAPGSRSAPLAFAVHAAADAGRVSLHVRVDERSAAFLALGLAKTSRRPVPVVTTSGTAVANLHPAVLEASHAGVPLVVVSADRPAELRGTNANQTTDQVKIFGDAVREFADLPQGAPGATETTQVAAWRSLVSRMLVTAQGGTTHAAGPVHLNVQLAEPLTPDVEDGWSAAVDGRPDGRAWTERPAPAMGRPEPVRADLRTVVVAGDDAGPPARLLAERAGWPLLAEPTSGSRTGANALRSYRLLLGDEALAGRIQQVVVFGHPTLSRPVTRLLSRGDVEIVAVEGPSGWTDPGHRVSRVVRAAYPDDQDPDAGRWDPGDGPRPPRPTTPWLEEWQRRDVELSGRLDDLLDAERDLTPHHVAAAVSAAVPADGLLLVGASNPVRDLDLTAVPYPVGERRLVIANRGLAGIDGSVSTAVGAALGRPRSSRALALLGDVTFLHDSNGLVIGPGEERPDLTIVVVNDDGGSIFTGLEQGGPAHVASFEKLFGTPHGTDLGALCAASHVPHRRVTTRDDLAEAVASPRGGIEVMEAVVRRDNRRELDASIRALVD
ncbi:MAG TPA: 2-succinyl-5-enolpyruvyl-6-hydroxy-3-cyclohexene-1-carboxylic-acid synthase [Nocardioidaceae bacterium]